LIKQVHDVGSLVMLQVTTVAQAVAAAERGVDAIIAQGGEAGGYGGVVSTMALVPQVCGVASRIEGRSSPVPRGSLIQPIARTITGGGLHHEISPLPTSHA
jgi:NAD(P)H-dependent flavin oxidoreductase YrpB (nitropropane dioxygenase family)